MTIDHKIKSELATTNKTGIGYAEKPQIVVVEDEPTAVLFLELQLQQHFHLKFFNNAEEAYQYMLANMADVDLIILDNMLPGMSGMGLVSLIKQNPGLKYSPVILQSADDKSVLDSHAAQPDFYLQKPWTKEQMARTIKQALGIK